MKDLKWIIAVIIIFIIPACKKESNSTPPLIKSDMVKHLNAEPLGISKIEPASGIVFSAMRITGTGFSTVPAENVVKINGVEAKVNYSTATQIIVTVPPRATTGKVSVTINSTTASAADNFRVLQLVKEGSLPQPANSLYRLSIDKNGNIFGAQSFPKYKSVVKYANGKIITLFRTKNDTSYTYSLDNVIHTVNINSKIVGLMNDGQGNTYPAIDVETTSTEGNTVVLTFKVSVYKITPTGEVSIYVDDLYPPNSGFEGGDSKNQAVIMDESGSIYYHDNGILFKYVDSGKPQQLVYYGAAADQLAVDDGGNVYGHNGGNEFYGGSVFKVSPQRVYTTINKFNDPVSAMVIDTARNLFLATPNGIKVINRANNVSDLSLGFGFISLAIDHSGRLYTLSSKAITRYVFK